MRSAWRIAGLLAVGAAAVVAAVLLSRQRPEPRPGMVRVTEIRIAPEVSGRVAAIHAKPGDAVHAGDVLVELANPELVAAVAEARADAAAARALRDRVYAGMRQEQVDILAREVEKAGSNVTLASQDFTRVSTLAQRQALSRQEADKAAAELRVAQAELAVARAKLAEGQAGPTAEERAIADAKVAGAEAAVAVLERRLDKTTLRAPADGTVRVVSAEPGEAVVPGRSTMTVEVTDEPWFSLVLREDRLAGLDVGASVDLVSPDGRKTAARITEIRALGEFATWQATRAVGDHDLNSFVVRADRQGESARPALAPGMTVWLARPR